MPSTGVFVTPTSSEDRTPARITSRWPEQRPLGGSFTAEACGTSGSRKAGLVAPLISAPRKVTTRHLARAGPIVRRKGQHRFEKAQSRGTQTSKSPLLWCGEPKNIAPSFSPFSPRDSFPRDKIGYLLIASDGLATCICLRFCAMHERFRTSGSPPYPEVRGVSRSTVPEGSSALLEGVPFLVKGVSLGSIGCPTKRITSLCARTHLEPPTKPWAGPFRLTRAVSHSLPAPLEHLFHINALLLYHRSSFQDR